MISYFNSMNFLRNNFTKNINWVCHHAHLDKSKIITSKRLESANSHMEDKWNSMKDVKLNYTNEDVYNRMNQTVINIAKQGCSKIRTFIDIDSTVGLMCVREAERLRKNWKALGITIQLATQPLEGLAGNDVNIKLFEDATNICDVVGCLPSRDRDIGKFDEHLDIVFRRAEILGKPIEAHLDQLNTPNQHETEIFCDFVEKYNFQGKVRSIHSISLACHSLQKQNEIAERLRDLNIGVIICPSAAISMTQHNEYLAPIHNSIAPLKVLLDAGVEVGLGIDNIHDLFMPFCDGDLEFELRLLAEATRIYDLDILKNIAENNMGFS